MADSENSAEDIRTATLVFSHSLLILSISSMMSLYIFYTPLMIYDDTINNLYNSHSQQ